MKYLLLIILFLLISCDSAVRLTQEEANAYLDTSKYFYSASWIKRCGCGYTKKIKAIHKETKQSGWYNLKSLSTGVTTKFIPDDNDAYLLAISKVIIPKEPSIILKNHK